MAGLKVAVENAPAERRSDAEAELVFARAAKYVDVAGFLVQRLTGLYRTGWGSADPTGMFDMNRNA